MIDLSKVRKAFDAYVEQYNSKDGKIKLKIDHIKRVADISRKLAMQLNLSNEEIKLAQLIGWLHDIGRFEQIKRYNTFVDKDSINHGELGVDILFNDDLIREFIEDTKYDEIIKKAIRIHNTKKVPKGLTKQEDMQARMIRDSDKIDIYYVLTTDTIENIYGVSTMENDTIKDEIVRQFKEDNYIDYSLRETTAEILVSHIIYVYDLNYTSSLEMIKEKGYINKLANRYKFANKDTYDKIQECARLANEYIKEKTK